MSRPKIKKIPLLDLLAEQYPEWGREQLFSRVLCGEVLVDGVREKNPKALVWATAELVFSTKRFVSRGGFKLDAALGAWNIPVADLVWLDAGASTGGFTDALLQRGARLVHAVDVGFNQLDFSLRQNPRVQVHEKTNLMSLECLAPVAQAAAADLSFRSLRGAGRKLLDLTAGGPVIALLKPQFEEEALRQVGVQVSEFTGVVDPVHLKAVLLTTLEGLWQEGAYARRLLASPIRGRSGNQEYLVWLAAQPALTWPELAESVAQLFSR